MGRRWRWGYRLLLRLDDRHRRQRRYVALWRYDIVRRLWRRECRHWWWHRLRTSGWRCEGGPCSLIGFGWHRNGCFGNARRDGSCPMTSFRNGGLSLKGTHRWWRSTRLGRTNRTLSWRSWVLCHSELCQSLLQIWCWSVGGPRSWECLRRVIESSLLFPFRDSACTLSRMFIACLR